MKKTKYLEKVTKILEKDLKENNLNDNFSINYYLDSSKNPMITIEYPNGYKKDYNLLNSYETHEYEDISTKVSVSTIRQNILNEIRLFMNETSRNQTLQNNNNGLYENISLKLCKNNLSSANSLYYKRTIGDMFYYISINENNSFPLQRDDNYSEDELFEIAKNNINNKTFKIYENLFLNIPFDLYYVYESEALLSDNFMNEIKNKFGTEAFYILPSSINEILFVKKDLISTNTLQEILVDTNNNNVITPNDIVLSNYIYEYNFETKSLEIATQERSQNLTSETNLTINEEIETTNNDNNNELINNNEQININRPSLSPEYQNNYSAPLPIEHNNDIQETNNENFLPDYEAEGYDSMEDYFADYDTDYSNEFAEEMLKFFTWKIGNSFHLERQDLVNGNLRIDLNEANNHYQSNDQDFLEFGNYLVDKYHELEEEFYNEQDNDYSENEDADYEDNNDLPY